MQQICGTVGCDPRRALLSRAVPDLAIAPLRSAGPEAHDAAALHRRLDDLHQMIYRRGGIRPVNAAIEELSKLLLLELKLVDDPGFEITGRGSLARILDPERLALNDNVDAVKDAFRCVASLPEYAGRVPGGELQPIWPRDEPLRISRPDVVAEAVRILRGAIRGRAAGRFDLIGTAFDVFLRGRYDHSGGLGTHLTPHTVATHLARICLSGLELLREPVTGPIIGDPCCGTGRFLVAACDELARAGVHDLAEFAERGLFGADQSASAVAKARINLLLMGVRHPNVFTVEDSILDAHVDALRGQLRLILTNPPFGDGKYDSPQGIQLAASSLRGLAGKRTIDPALAFVVRCLELLRDGGRLGIVLPDGLVDGPVLRDALLGSESVRLRDVSVEANVSLPTATFALAGTVARTSALVLRRQRARRSHIFLARAEHVGHLKQGAFSVPDPEGDDLPTIAAAATSFLSRALTAEDPNVRFIYREPLAAVLPVTSTKTLDPARVDPDAVSARNALRVHGVLFRERLRLARRRQRKSDGSAAFISVLHIDDLGAVAWHEARTYRPSTPGLEAHPNDVIFSLLNPRKLRATVIPEDVGLVYCSSEFGVFEPLQDPYETLVLFHHPLVRAQLAPLGRGTSSSRRRITPNDLLEVAAPCLPREDIRSLGARLRSSLESLRRASTQAADLYAAASAHQPVG